MIVGNDISNFQGQLDWITYIQNSNFVICKASEGTSYIDTWFGYNRAEARQYKIARGWYHFARPDLGNSAEAEAQFFCNLMNGDPLQEGEIVALDFEVTYNDPVTWCKKWLDIVFSNLGVKPLIYLNQSLATNYDWQSVVDAGYGLWIAAYTYDPTNNNFQSGKWQTVAMQQWTDQQTVPGISGNVDGDCFFGTIDQFKAYGYHKIQPVQPAPEPQVTPITNDTPSDTANIVITSAQPTQVPTNQSQTIISTVSTNPIAPKPPKKPSLDLLSTIVWIIKNIFNVLIYGSKNTTRN